MGDLFKKPKLQSSSSLSAEQQALLAPLGDFIRPFLANGGSTPEIQSLTEQLFRSTTDEAKALSERVFSDAFMKPALENFDREIAPRINSTFAGYGGTLSTRRTSTTAEALANVSNTASGQFAQLLPQIQAFPLQQTLSQIQGLDSLQTQRFRPFSSALQFALSPTQSTQQSPGGPGWGLLNSAIGAGGFVLGGGLK